MLRACLLALALVLMLSACGAEGRPEDEARKLVNLLKYADQEGFDAVQAELFALLDAGSRQSVEARCQAARSALEGHQPGPPAACLVFQGFPLGRGLKAVERVEGSASRVRLRLVMDGGPALLDFVKEDGRWKLDLQGSLELAREPRPKGESGGGTE